MKIEVVSFTGDSGLADYAVSLARALASDVETTVVTARSLPTRFDRMGFRVRRVFRRSRHYPIDVLRFFVGVLKRRPDWALLQGPLKFVWVDALIVRALRLLGQKVAVTVHDVLPHYPKPWSRFTFGFYYRSFQRVVVHSEAALQGIRSLGVQAPVLVVPHGVYDIFRLTGITSTEARSLIGGLDEADFVVLFFGHLESRKGLVPFVRAAEAMRESHPRVKFLLAGANGLAGYASEQAEQLLAARTQQNVVLHDRRIPFEEVEHYFSACNLVALPYLEGTTSGVLKLALAFGKPVVATRVGDFPEQVPVGAGVFISNREHLVEELCRAIVHVQANEAQFIRAMEDAGSAAAWPDIASRVIRHLQGG